MKQAITEKTRVHELWYEEAKKQTVETLPAFINHLVNDYFHDYGTIGDAITAGAIAAAHAINKSNQGGITGFQAGLIMWSFIQHWDKSDNKTGMKLIDYDGMLYPQYADRFDKIISKETFEKLQTIAKENLEKYSQRSASRYVMEHWERIVEGVVPFGYEVKG